MRSADGLDAAEVSGTGSVVLLSRTFTVIGSAITVRTDDGEDHTPETLIS